MSHTWLTLPIEYDIICFHKRKCTWKLEWSTSNSVLLPWTGLSTFWKNILIFTKMKLFPFCKDMWNPKRTNSKCPSLSLHAGEKGTENFPAWFIFVLSWWTQQIRRTVHLQLFAKRKAEHILKCRIENTNMLCCQSSQWNGLHIWIQAHAVFENPDLIRRRKHHQETCFLVFAFIFYFVQS